MKRPRKTVTTSVECSECGALTACRITPGSPAVIHAPPEDCRPEEPDECEPDTCGACGVELDGNDIAEAYNDALDYYEQY